MADFSELLSYAQENVALLRQSERLLAVIEAAAGATQVAQEAEKRRDRVVSEADEAQAKLDSVRAAIENAKEEYRAVLADIERTLALAKDWATTQAAATIVEVEADVKAQVATLKAAIPVLEARVAELSAGIATLEDRKARLDAAIGAAIVIKGE